MRVNVSCLVLKTISYYVANETYDILNNHRSCKHVCISELFGRGLYNLIVLHPTSMKDSLNHALLSLAY